MVAVTERLAQTHDVVLAAPRAPSPQQWRDRGFAEIPITVMNARAAMRASFGRDLFVTQTNYVPLPSFARRSLLIVQFPTDTIGQFSSLRRVGARTALRRYRIATYSDFCRGHIEQRWGATNVQILPPPVQQYPYDPSAKDRSIVSVGRFISTGHAKRQDVLLEAWALLADRLPGWRLHLIGGGSSHDPYVARIMKRAADLQRVTVSLDMRPDDLATAYARADIVWHAAGFERPPDAPEQAEHFGIAPIEAMSAGAVPVVHDDGGPAEVVRSGTGIVWRSLEDLIEATAGLARDDDRRRAMQAEASVAARRFTRAGFDRRLEELVHPRRPERSGG